MPGGLFPDEAANGLDINLMQSGHLQPFYERGNGREALFFYMEWASTAIFGKGQEPMHVTSALVGILTVVMVFFVAYRLFLVDPNEEDKVKLKARAIKIALLAAFLMAVSTWHVVLSRTAFRANLTPLFGALVIYLFLRTYQAESRKAQLWFALLAGASFALGFYTYIAFRVMVPIVFMMLAWPLLASIRKHQFATTVKKYFLPAVIALIAFIIFIFPIANYFYHNFDYFIGRSGQVSIGNPSLYTVNGAELTGAPTGIVLASVFGEVVKTTVAGFFTHGDLNWRQNISGYPLLSPLISPFFGLGLIAMLILGIWYFFAPDKRAGFWKYFLLTGWFWGMLLPEMTTAEGIPHALRSAGAVAPAFIITAWALYEVVCIVIKLHKKLWQQMLPRHNDPQWIHDSHFIPARMRLVNTSFKVLGALFCLALISQTYNLYFVYAANSPEYFYAFRADLTSVSQYLRDRCDKDHTYLVLDKFSIQTTDYLTSDPHGNFSDKCNVPYHQVDPEHVWQLSNLKTDDEIIFTQSSIFDIKKFKAYHPEAHLIFERRNKFEQSTMAIYKVGEVFYETVSLKVGQETQIPAQALSLKLLSVNDSRCPIKVQCFWAGTVTAKVEFFKNSTSLGTAEISLDKQVSIQGYSIGLSQVEPQKNSGKLKMSDYNLIFTIRN